MEAQGEAFDKLRREAFFHAPNDERIALLTLSAEQNGRGEWVRPFARSCVAERQPMRMALGLTTLGFCDERTVPSELCEYKDLIGDLAITANRAKHASERNAWARHWHSMASGAATPEEMWRYGELMVRAADFRFVLWLPLPGDAPVGSPWQRFCLLYPERLVQCGKKEAAERTKKLYGREPPRPPIDTLLGLSG
jgi:hypothetical protein